MDERLIDISASGCRFSSPVIFNDGETVVINLPANARGRWISGRRYLLGRIVWCRANRHQRTEYGVKVLN
jgi:hypothetical protein